MAVESFRFSSFLSVLFAFSLGADECVDNESVPLQQTEHHQQGKQFDHTIPIIFKSNTLFTNCMYACFCVKVILSLRGSYSYCIVASKLLSPATNPKLLISLVN